MIDQKFRRPRMWSNLELKKFSQLFEGKVANVSGWQDSDKQGAKYKEYFVNANEYWITNYRSDIRGYQGNLQNELFLDLTKPLPVELHNAFDIVFNHTVLEHIFEFDAAFDNLCKLTKDIVILVVPFLQEQHGAYGDYWRFSPQALDKMFHLRDMEVMYINYNDQRLSSIYIFAIGSRQPNKWKAIRDHRDNKLEEIYKTNIGTNIIRNSLFKKLISRTMAVVKKT